MIDEKDLSRKTRALLDLIHEKFGIKADKLDIAMRKIGRRLPKRAHTSAKVLVDAQAQAGHPKLMLQGDMTRVAAAYETLKQDLDAVDRADRRKGAILGTLGALSFNLIALVVLLVAFLMWRGLI
ncbi:hypothetical protein [Shimia abyssi]|uniref:Uncharacterized protein n=1 Tax=Shimia abyssi TaxID=1662395 RepID=A0A2P8FKA2_9RHOB|nr:hypothetical protein [Shimia abyssi]PSL22144.1 hypothetical protein CLV88_101569 [Shimia abyssi]